MAQMFGAMSGTIVYAIGQWMLILLIARLGTIEMLGQYAMVLALASPLFMLANLRLRFVLASSVDWIPFSEYLLLRVVLVGVASAASVLVGYAAGAHASAGLWVLLAMVGFKAFESTGDIGLGLFQAKEKLGLVGRTMWLLTISLVGSFGVVLYLTGSLGWACGAMALVRLCVLGLYEAPNWIMVEAQRSKEAGRNPGSVTGWDAATANGAIGLFRRSWPLGGAAVLDSLNTNLPRYFVSATVGNAGLGAFVAMTTLAQGVFLVVNSLCQVKLRGLAAEAHRGRHVQFWRRLSVLAGFAMLVGGAGIAMAVLLGPWALEVIFGGNVAAQVTALPPIMAAGLFSGLALVATYGLTALGDFRFQVLGYAACTLATLILCFLAMSWPHLDGFAIAVATAQAVHVAAAIALLLRVGLRQLNLGSAS